MGCCRPFTYASDRTTNGITATCNDEKNETAIKTGFYHNGCAITSPNASDGTLEGFGFPLYPRLEIWFSSPLSHRRISRRGVCRKDSSRRPMTPTDIALQTYIDRYRCIDDLCCG